MNKIYKWILASLLVFNCLSGVAQTQYTVSDSNNVPIGVLTVNKPFVMTVTNVVEKYHTNIINVVVTNPPPVVNPTNPPVIVTNPPPVVLPTNTVTPSVYAGPDVTITSLVTTLNGRIQTPTNGVTSKWSGPASVIFGNPTSPTTTATFPGNGTYNLKFTANNGPLGGSDDLNVTVNISGGSTNVPPSITNQPPVIVTNPPPVVQPPVTNSPPPVVVPPSTNTALFFLRAGATGANNGSDWNNAWSDTDKIQWGSTVGKVGAGAILYVAGGTYKSFSPGASGTSDGNRITIRRATANSSDCVKTIGWNASYDSQAIVGGSSTALSFGGNGNWTTFDGVVDGGIRFITPNSDGASVSFDKATTGVTLTNLDLAGPGGTQPVNMNGDNRGIDATAWNGSTFEKITNLLLTHCRIHGQVNNLWLHTVSDSIIEYNKFYDSGAVNSTTYHANVVATANSKNIVWRYNEIYNHQVEGIMFIFGGAGSWYIYGNVWHDGMTQVSRILEVQDGVEGPIYFYNNTVANVVMGLRTANGGVYAPGSQARDNLFYNAGTYTGLSDTSNDVIVKSPSPAPYVGSGNFRLTPTSPAKDAGINLGVPYNLDPDGKVRGADGMWDVGAYEF